MILVDAARRPFRWPPRHYLPPPLAADGRRMPCACIGIVRWPSAAVTAGMGGGNGHGSGHRHDAVAAVVRHNETTNSLGVAFISWAILLPRRPSYTLSKALIQLYKMEIPCRNIDDIV